MDNYKKQLEEERELNEVLVRFICHNLTNPLTVMKNYLILLKQDRIPPEELQNIIQRIDQSNQYALSILAKVKKHTQARKNANSLALEDLDFGPSLEKSLASLEAEAQEKQMAFRYQSHILGHSLVRAHAQALYENVFGPLLSNAIKFSSPGDFIDINTYETQDGYEIEIRDYGIGLKHDLGLGFGIPTVKTYLHHFSGHLRIQLQDKGLSLIIFLPRSPGFCLAVKQDVTSPLYN